MPQKLQQICEGINWIDILEPTNAEMEEISKTYGLNHHLVHDCVQPEHLPKYERADDVHFIILRFYTNKSENNNSTIQDLTSKIAIFFTTKFMITIHMAETPFLEKIRKKFVSANKCFSTTDLLARVVWEALETFLERVSRLSEQVDFFEQQIMLRKTNNDQIEALYIIKREAALSQKVLMLMNEPIGHIFVESRSHASLQDVKDQHLKMLTLYGQVLDEVNSLMNLFMSFASQRTNDVVKLLTIFSVFFMPLTFIAGIYGMNFLHMPELKQTWGYPAVILLMVLVTAVIYSWFKKKRWL